MLATKKRNGCMTPTPENSNETIERVDGTVCSFLQECAKPVSKILLLELVSSRKVIIIANFTPETAHPNMISRHDGSTSLCDYGWASHSF
jgi:hypothetical protein